MTQNRVDKRRIWLFLLLPVLILAAIAFYALGGGRPIAADPAAPKGINTVLPDAVLKKENPTDKLGIYEQDKSDSAHLGKNNVKAITDRLGLSPTGDAQATQIQTKLAAINQEISRPYTPPRTYVEPVSRQPYRSTPPSGDVARLESLMRSMQQNTGGKDPQMVQLNTLMDKIMDVQNPGRVKARLAKEADKNPDSLFKAIPAVIDGRQKVGDGSVVKLKLLDTVLLNGVMLPKGQAIYGLVSISNQRLNLEIKNIGMGNTIVPVNLTVFDQKDSMTGIYAPEAVLGNTVGGGADNALQNMQFLSMDASLGVQAGTAGINAAKSLFSKKVRRIRVKLKNGYPLLLRDNSKKYGHG